MFYTVVVQAVILYNTESWVMYPWIGKTLGGVHHRVMWRLTGQMPQQNKDWVCT